MTELTETYTCPACRAIPTWCDHTPEEWALATALAAHFQETASPTDEQVGWFVDDADGVAAQAGPGPWTFRTVEALGGWDSAVIINEVLFCGMREGEGPVPLEPVCRVPAGGDRS